MIQNKIALFAFVYFGTMVSIGQVKDTTLKTSMMPRYMNKKADTGQVNQMERVMLTRDMLVPEGDVMTKQAAEEAIAELSTETKDSSAVLRDYINNKAMTPGPQGIQGEPGIGIKGDKGEPGANGINGTNGSDASVTLANVTNALSTGSFANPSWITSLAWGKITGTPALFDGNYNSLTNKPVLFSGAYADLTGKPNLFSGSYTDLTNKPTIPTNTNQLTNGNGYQTAQNVSDSLNGIRTNYMSNSAANAAIANMNSDINGRVPQARTITINGVAQDLSANRSWTIDGSETKVTAGANVSITGAGTTASPYVVNSTAPNIVFLANVNVTETAAIALNAGVRKVTITGVTGLLAGDRVLLNPFAATPAGYALADAVATANGTLQVSLTAPLLALGASYSIPCKVTVFR